MPAAELRKGDIVLVKAGDIIPCDGEVIEGGASVDESAITGESAPVIRESGGDFASVTGGTRILSDWLVIACSVNPGETFLDRMIAMVEGAQRRKTPNEIALTILLIALTIVFLLVTATLWPFSAWGGNAVSVTVLVALLVCLIPNYHRRATLRHWRSRNEPNVGRERHRHQRPRRRSRGRCRRVTAG